MNLDLDFMDIAGDRLSEMRLLVEGAITLFEDEASVLCHLARDALQGTGKHGLDTRTAVSRAVAPV